ncbi:MAG: glycosyltransferase [Thermodesulfobacteriota bacterium]
MEVLARPQVLSSYFSLYSLIACIAYAFRTKSWVARKCRDRKLNVSRTIFYTYWFGAPTLGLVLAKKKYPGLVIVTRAHGGDLYEERNAQAYLPCRAEMIQGVTSIYTVSLDGHNYLAKKYPQSQRCCKVARLGVDSRQFITACSTDGVFRILSCSTLVPVKRVDLIIKSLSALAGLKPEIKFEWNHIGNGPQRKNLEAFAHSILPLHVLWKFHGSMDNKQVFEFYRDNSIDLFINLSESEGIPVAIMEAQSCGVPVISTAVGGIPEIVNDNNGILLPADPNPHDVAQALQRLITDPQCMREKRAHSKASWYSHYNADTNYRKFSSGLLRLLESSCRTTR